MPGAVVLWPVLPIERFLDRIKRKFSDLFSGQDAFQIKHMSLSFSIQKKNEPNKKRKIAVMGFDDEEPDQKKSKQEIEEDQKAQSEALKNQGNALAEQGTKD
jgi:hypothetical protein